MIPAIIIARGGSKRLPRKNVLPFCGLPLVEWSILQAVYSYHIGAENTYLSTDDDEIASIGQKHNINIIHRPDYPNPDELGGWFVNAEALKEIGKTKDFEAFISILPTSPIRFPNNMDRIISEYKKVVSVDSNCRAMLYGISQKEILLYKKVNDKQVVRWLIDKTGCFIREAVLAGVANTEYYFQDREVIGATDKEFNIRWMDFGKLDKPLYYLEAEWYQEYDIDDLDNFELCEILMEKYILKGHGPEIYEEYARRI